MNCEERAAILVYSTSHPMRLEKLLRAEGGELQDDAHSTAAQL
jgi:hypothetical protein